MTDPFQRQIDKNTTAQKHPVWQMLYFIQLPDGQLDAKWVLSTDYAELTADLIFDRFSDLIECIPIFISPIDESSTST